VRDPAEINARLPTAMSRRFAAMQRPSDRAAWRAEAVPPAVALAALHTEQLQGSCPDEGAENWEGEVAPNAERSRSAWSPDGPLPAPSGFCACSRLRGPKTAVPVLQSRGRGRTLAASWTPPSRFAGDSSTAAPLVVPRRYASLG